MVVTCMTLLSWLYYRLSLSYDMTMIRLPLPFLVLSCLAATVDYCLAWPQPVFLSCVVIYPPPLSILIPKRRYIIVWLHNTPTWERPHIYRHRTGTGAFLLLLLTHLVLGCAGGEIRSIGTVQYGIYATRQDCGCTQWRRWLTRLGDD